MSREQEPELNNPDAAAELWVAFDGEESQPAESEGNDHAGMERPTGQIPFESEDEGHPGSLN